MNGSVADPTKNVKRWRGTQMILRCAGVATVEARKRFHKIHCHRDLVSLVQALERHDLKQGARTEAQPA